MDAGSPIHRIYRLLCLGFDFVPEAAQSKGMTDPLQWFFSQVEDNPNVATALANENALLHKYQTRDSQDNKSFYNFEC